MVGSAICRAFRKMGYNNLITVEKKELNLLEESAVKEWFKVHKPDHVVHAAAKVGGIVANNDLPVEFLVENIKIQTNVIENAYLNKVKRFLFLGSSCIYPKFAAQPIREESLLQLPLEETNEAYALAKITGIKLIQFLRQEKSFDGISLMPTNLYGPNDNYNLGNSHVLPALIRKIYEAKLHNKDRIECWGTGTPLREFLYVDDLGEAVVFALEKWNPNHNNAPKDNNGNKLTYLNVGTGEDISIKELVNIIKQKIGYKGNIFWNTNKPDGTPKKQLNVSRINKLGWRNKVSLSEGIERTIIFFKDEMDNKTIRL